MLVSRFLINLSQSNASQETSSAHGTLTHNSTLNFRSRRTVDAIIDNLGAPLDFNEYCAEDELWEDHESTARHSQEVKSMISFYSGGDSWSSVNDKFDR